MNVVYLIAGNHRKMQRTKRFQRWEIKFASFDYAAIISIQVYNFFESYSISYKIVFPYKCNDDIAFQIYIIQIKRNNYFSFVIISISSTKSSKYYTIAWWWREMKGLPSTEWSDRIESNPICFHCELFQCRSIRDHSRLTSTSDVPFSAPLRHVRWTRVRKRERNGLQIAFAIETNTAKWSLSPSLPLSIGASRDRPRSKENKSRIDD